MIEGVVFLWFLFAIIVAVAANTRGRSGIGWFLMAVILSPAIAGLLVLALPWRESAFARSREAKLDRLIIEPQRHVALMRLWLNRAIIAAALAGVAALIWSGMPPR